MSAKIERRQFLQSGASMMAAALLPTCSSLFAQDATGNAGVHGDATHSVAAIPVPEWPQGPRAPAVAPNIVLILIDDVGFSATSTFGGPVKTPNFDKLAEAGIALQRVSCECALLADAGRAAFGKKCSSRSVLEPLPNWRPGYPAITRFGRRPRLVAEVLKDNGYSTAAFGKWHNTPAWQVSPPRPI